MIAKINQRISEISTDGLFKSFVILFLILAFVQAFSHLHLYADGSHLLLNLLGSQAVFNPTPHRFIANALQQFLPLFLIKIGIEDLEAISVAYGLNLYLLPLLSILISYSLLPSDKKHLIQIQILGTVFLMHNNYQFIVDEAFVTITIFWPLFFYALFSSIKPLSSGVFILGLICLPFTHELAFLPLILLALSVAARWKNPIEGATKRVLIGGSVVAVLIMTLTSTFFPSYFDSAEDLSSQLTQLLSLKQYPLSLLAIVLIIIQAIFKLSGKIQYIIRGVIGILALLILLPVVNPSGMLYPILHWEQRILIIIGTTILALVLILTQVFFSRNFSLSGSRWSFILLSSTIFVYQVRMTSLWNDYRNTLNDVLTQGKSIIEYEDTELFTQPDKRQFSTVWTTTSLGLLLHTFEDKQIKRLINIPRDQWQAWYARDAYGWPDLGAYGVRYRLFGPNSFVD